MILQCIVSCVWSSEATARCVFLIVGGHGEVTVSGFSPSGRFGLLIQPQQPPSGLQCLHLRPRRFEFDI